MPELETAQTFFTWKLKVSWLLGLMCDFKVIFNFQFYLFNNKSVSYVELYHI